MAGMVGRNLKRDFRSRTVSIPIGRASTVESYGASPSMPKPCGNLKPTTCRSAGPHMELAFRYTGALASEHPPICPYSGRSAFKIRLQGSRLGRGVASVSKAGWGRPLRGKRWSGAWTGSGLLRSYSSPFLPLSLDGRDECGHRAPLSQVKLLLSAHRPAVFPGWRRRSPGHHLACRSPTARTHLFALRPSPDSRSERCSTTAQVATTASRRPSMSASMTSDIASPPRRWRLGSRCQ